MEKAIKLKNILITGGSGYIGSILTEILLIKGFNVTVLDLFEHSTSSLSFASTCKSFDAYKVDVLDLEALTPFIANSDVIIPLAGLVGAPICAQHKTLAELLNYKQVKDN